MPDEEPEVEVVDSENEPEVVSQVVPDDLENKPAPKQEAPKPEVKTPQASPEIARLNNTIAYQTRQLQKAMSEMQALKEQFSKPQKVSENQDEIDEIAQKDWKQGVKKVVEKDIESKVQEILNKREEALAEVQRRNLSEVELDKSKKRVMDRYPEIEQSGSEPNRIYLEVLNEDQSLLRNIHGPEIAMYRMEERLRQMGRTPANVKPIVDREVNRLARAGASNVIGRTASVNGKPTLSKEQKEFCDHHKISYENYLKNLKSQGSREGVEA